ncbi:MAG: Rnase Y domain-containing protein, partial [Chloroflexota bacterium]
MGTIGTATILGIFFSFVIGAIFGGMAAFLSRRVMFAWQMRVAERKAAKILAEARNESKSIVHESQEEAKQFRATAEAEHRERRAELQRQENRLSQKSETLERKLEGVDQRDRNLVNKEKSIESLRNQITELKDKQLKQLELISGMSSPEAKQTLLDNMEVEIQQETSRRLR